MHRPRVIAVLLIKDRGLVKSLRFNAHKYIGDPLNAVRIFNELEADELIVLDIEATATGRLISANFVSAVAEEVTMPFSVGGGIGKIEDIRSLIALGVEKVIIGSSAACDPSFIKLASQEFGSSTIAVCIDVKKDLFRRSRVCYSNGRKYSRFEPVEFAQLMELNGAGELIVQSIDRDGTMIGYDIELIKGVSSAVEIPVIALGGAGNHADLADAFKKGYASGAGAGSLFVYHGKERGVLINYPTNMKSDRFYGE